MCGRFTQTTDIKKIAKELKIPIIKVPKFKPRYNIAPSQPVAVAVHELSRDPQIDFFRWGLIPSWAKDPAIGNRMINARKETLAEKPSFRGPLKNQRCLIPSDGFYEWKQEGKSKVPYYIRMKSGELFAFAGLWSCWLHPDGSELRTCAIITGEPNELIRPIHHRMPMIVPRAKWSEWIEPLSQDVKNLLAFLEPYPSGEMVAYPVSKFVNDPSHDAPECLEKVAQQKMILN